MIALILIVTVVHELIHGAAHRIFGGKAKFGLKGIYAYTHEVSERPLERIKFLIVLLAPLVSMSLISLIFPTWLGGMIFLLNLLESLGYLYMEFTLIKYGPKAKIIDKKEWI